MIKTSCYQIITFQNANKHQNLNLSQKKNLEMQSVSIINFRKIKALSFTMFQKEAAIQKLRLTLGKFLITQCCCWLRNKTKYFTNLTWPPHPKHLDNPPDMPEELLMFLVWLKYPTRKPEECTLNNPQIVALGDFLLANIVNKRTKFWVNVVYPSFLLLCKICENMGFL